MAQWDKDKNYSKNAKVIFFGRRFVALKASKGYMPVVSNVSNCCPCSQDFTEVEQELAENLGVKLDNKTRWKLA